LFVEAVNTGKLTDAMLVWKPGMANWERFAEARTKPEVSALPGLKYPSASAGTEPPSPLLNLRPALSRSGSHSL